jgi:hypothetical protein
MGDEMGSVISDDLNRRLTIEAADYFRSRPGFGRLLDQLVKKYQRLGKLGGVIVLEEVSPEERQTLETFFRRRLPGNKLRFSTGLFEKALVETRFGGLNLLDFLVVWHGGALVTQSEQRENAEQVRQKVLQQLMMEHPTQVCQKWLKAALDKAPDTRQVQLALFGDRNFIGNMVIALQALANLPQTYQRIPVFVRKICGDPHGLDLNRGAGKLFLEGLRYLRDHENDWDNKDNGVAKLSATEELNELLYHFKLLRELMQMTRRFLIGKWRLWPGLPLMCRYAKLSG